MPQRACTDFREIPAKWLRLFPAIVIWLQSSGKPSTIITTVQRSSISISFKDTVAVSNAPLEEHRKGIGQGGCARFIVQAGQY